MKPPGVHVARHEVPRCAGQHVTTVWYVAASLHMWAMGGVVSGPVTDADEFRCPRCWWRRQEEVAAETAICFFGLSWLRRTYVPNDFAYSTTLVEPNRRGRTRRCLS